MLIIDSSQQYDEELKILSDGIEDQHNLIDRLRLDNQTEMSGKRKKLEDAKERLKSTEVELKREEESLKSFLRNGCERVLKHKTIIENRVKEVQKNTKEWSVKMRSAIPEVSCVLSKDEIDRILEDTHEEVQESANLEEQAAFS
ncbi:uncharacterized protein LOC124459346 [Xenia sp. Carnegie-2017]|uniref:uncharacterized protein LOC124459346 n=1 Tax=Xenia sp. Carnegie-2017 TaxID=2897299 RepID=UPI001F03E00D|nr:uncharacterized protein LOC124459346 [Xenia sp. Carnegie-2017]